MVWWIGLEIPGMGLSAYQFRRVTLYRFFTTNESPFLYVVFFERGGSISKEVEEVKEEEGGKSSQGVWSKETGFSELVHDIVVWSLDPGPVRNIDLDPGAVCPVECHEGFRGVSFDKS